MFPVLLIIHMAATSFMTGLIWFVQIVHYPLMARVNPQDFDAYESEHRRRTTWVVAPAMGVELATACGLLWFAPSPGKGWAILNLCALAAIWLLTFFVQVPQHVRLTRSFDAATHRALVQGNWLRTFLWSARAVLVGCWF